MPPSSTFVLVVQVQVSLILVQVTPYLPAETVVSIVEVLGAVAPGTQVSLPRDSADIVLSDPVVGSPSFPQRCWLQGTPIPWRLPRIPLKLKWRSSAPW